MSLSLPYRSLAEYLEAKGLLNAPEHILERAKREWNTLYQKAYKERYDKKQINFVLSQDDYAELCKKAKEQGLKVTDYVRHLITKESKGLHPSVLIEIEVQLLTLLDAKVNLKEMKQALLTIINHIRCS
jgi:predicted DNA binding CopG/RHH family protein